MVPHKNQTASKCIQMQSNLVALRKKNTLSWLEDFPELHTWKYWAPTNSNSNNNNKSSTFAELSWASLVVMHLKVRNNLSGCCCCYCFCPPDSQVKSKTVALTAVRCSQLLWSAHSHLSIVAAATSAKLHFLLCS